MPPSSSRPAAGVLVEVVDVAHGGRSMRTRPLYDGGVPGRSWPWEGAVSCRSGTRRSRTSCSGSRGPAGRTSSSWGRRPATAGVAIVAFYEAFSRRDCEPSHLRLFGVPDHPAAARGAAGRGLGRRRQYREHARGLARPRDRSCPPRGLGARRRARRRERRRQLLVRGLRHRLVLARARELGDGLGLLAGSFCPHYDGEERRADVHAARRRRRSPPGFACDDVAGVHFEGTELREVVASRGRPRVPRHGRRRGAARDAPAVRQRRDRRRASGSGKSTVGRALARRLDVPFVEVEALVHGPNWVEATDDELRERLLPVLAGDGWVIDGAIVGSSAISWSSGRHDRVADLPVRVWFPVCSGARSSLRGREELWNGNRESFATRSAAGRRSSALRCGCTSRAAAAIRSSSPSSRSFASARRARSSAGSTTTAARRSAPRRARRRRSRRAGSRPRARSPRRSRRRSLWAVASKSMRRPAP